MNKLIAAFALTVVAAGVAQARSPVELSGTFAGTMTEHYGKNFKRYPMTLSFKGDEGYTSYPQLGCGGVLTRLAATLEGYTIYKEQITRGRAGDGAGGTCIDGIVILSQSKGVITLGWYASEGGEPVFASAKLTESPN
jgi:hypothetical protein